MPTWAIPGDFVFKEMDMDIYLIIIFSDIINCQEVKNVRTYVTQTIKQLSI